MMWLKSVIAGVVVFSAASVSAQTAVETVRPSVAIEADAIAYGLPGYSGIFNLSLPNGFQVAAGVGRYEVPSFLLKGDDHYDAVEWKATATSVQVFRVTYRVNGPMKNGPAVGAVVLSQKWRLRAAHLPGENSFRPLSVGLTGGYYQHIGQHFYIYPTAAFTYNKVVSGKAELAGTSYKVERLSPNASLHIGWEWSR